MRHIWQRFVAAENVVHALMVRYSVTLLRIAIGATFLAFGILKYFPGVSPAQNLAETTSHILFFGLAPGGVAIVVIATLECTIGLLLLSGRGLRLALYLLVAEFIGILSPLVLLSGRLFAGPHGAPTLEGQYVLKDITLVASAMVIAAASFRGGRLVRDEPSPGTLRALTDPRAFDAESKLGIVLSGSDGQRSVSDVCLAAGISPATYHAWRNEALRGATGALRANARPSNGAGPRA